MLTDPQFRGCIFMSAAAEFSSPHDPAHAAAAAHAMAIQEIYRDLAERAGVEVIHRGNVRRQVHRKWLGLKAADEHQTALSEAEFTMLNARHGRALLIVCAGLALLVAAGLAQDYLGANVDTGERGAEATSTKPSSEAQKAKPAPAKKS